MGTEILQYVFTTVIIGIVGIVARYAIPALKAWVESKGAGQWDKVMSYLQTVIDIVINFFKSHPEVQASAESIFTQFCTEFRKVLPWLSEAQLKFVFDSIVDIFADKIGIELEAFSKLDKPVVLSARASDVASEPLFK